MDVNVGELAEQLPHHPAVSMSRMAFLDLH